ncbi:MAG: AMP-binding protein, partial [Pseudomonadota bacterium]
MTREEAAATGMLLSFNASNHPDNPAIISDYGDRTFREMNDNVNGLVRVLRSRGLQAGDSVAMLCMNRPQFMETHQAAMRAGLRVTPINWHLTADEVAYIVDNCEAKAFVCDARFTEQAAAVVKDVPTASVRLSVDGDLPDYENYADVVAGESGEDIEDPVLGYSMLYTSGTTGRPKGVHRKPAAGGAPQTLFQRMLQSTAFDAENDFAICTGPAYHAAPLSLNIVLPLNAGIGVLLMDKWDAENTLRLIEKHKCTHTHMVATMFHRLLQLPDEIKQKYDISSMRWILHGAAPCPVHVKQGIIDWFGPAVWEYYAATEGGSTYIGSDEWLTKPGSVGKPLTDELMRIFDDDGNVVAQGETGTVYFKAPDSGRFEYYKAPEKTSEAYRENYFTMGDMGYQDDDGYLFLTGRSAETIISGGVNIYPQETDSVILQHPSVHDVCTIGIPNEEWGEEVRSVIQL